ncbi:MAG TPA: hypothetical protein DIS82_09410 [Exiguobacterium sp.]|uniref:hypothetical protein n=1 Tax=Exiguobacterium sp. TaxID=44751 RepID=UPI000EBC6B4C|nr:hypothetical protein [Exiguobacterium sp.]HCN58365.1 hypothetical protein [Exiguobacterium sp.]
MIYKKNANFPYPVLTNDSHSYAESNFILDVSLEESSNMYRLKYKYELDSPFLENLLKENRAQLLLIIQSRDNKYYRVGDTDKYVDIPKSRLSLNKRTSVQLQIQSKEEINFSLNEDLNDFYLQFKEKLNVSKHALLAYSNVVLFEGSTTKPFELFEKKVNPSLSSDIKIELGTETIIINYRNPEYQFVEFSQSNKLNNPYIYTGLSRALHQFIINNGEDQETVDLEVCDLPNSLLDIKLYQLMTKKMVTEISIDSIDEVIHKISDRIIDKYISAIKGLAQHGD